MPPGKMKNFFNTLTTFGKITVFVLIGIPIIFAVCSLTPPFIGDGICFPPKEDYYNSKDCAVETTISNIYELDRYDGAWVKFHAVDVFLNNSRELYIGLLTQEGIGYFFVDESEYGLLVTITNNYWKRNNSLLPRWYGKEVEVTCKIRKHYGDVIPLYSCYPVDNVEGFKASGDADPSFYSLREVSFGDETFSDSYIIAKIHIDYISAYRHIKRANLTHFSVDGFILNSTAPIIYDNGTFTLNPSVHRYNNHAFDFYEAVLNSDYVQVAIISNTPLPQHYLSPPYEILLKGAAWFYPYYPTIILVMLDGQTPYSIVNFIGDDVCGELENSTNSIDCL